MALPKLAAPQAAAWLAARVSGMLRTDHRLLQPGDGFIAWPGQRVDARRFVQAALDAGAAACLVEADGAEEAVDASDARIASVTGLQSQIGTIASAFHGHPSRTLRMLAVTGTNGKTSTAWWTAQALTALGQRCGVVGTLGIGAPGPVEALVDSGLTTPDAVQLQQALRGFVDNGYTACALEASSIGLQQQRLAGTHIDVALFSNLSRDHLDIHGSMEAYRDAKRMLFSWPGLRAAVLNIDDAVGAAFADELMLGNVEGALKVWTVSRQTGARLRVTNLRIEEGGLVFEVHETGAVAIAETVATVATVKSALVGDFNVDNLLLVIGALRASDVSLVDAAAAVSASSPVPGRLQRIDGRDLVVVVDYAHTPDALQKALQALRPLATARNGRLWCIVGCGGNRDATKRPLMGAVAAAHADHVVLTSDNPRDEAPSMILSQILAGVTGHDDVDVIEDRHAAIAGAVQRAARGDVLLLAGKGHEQTQEIAGVRRVFCDASEARAALAAREMAA
ncbi:MAG: UDP-N-acetylmuramoyl-L-alanyl-D-glutamate--2,6-diaminopimelate ligase [Rubrivivax sp.]